MNPNSNSVSKPSVIVRIWDGIGNQLFQYAYARALKERGIEVAIDLNKAYEKELFGYTPSAPRENAIQQFNITLSEIDVEAYGKYDYLRRYNYYHKIKYSLAKQGLWKYRYYKDPTAMYSERVDRITGHYYLIGWFQSEKYFKNIRHILLEELTLKSKPVISSDIGKYLNNPECISVHVRRGDYIKYNWDLPVEYYRKATETVKEKYKHPCFLVFSDDFNYADSILNNVNWDILNKIGFLWQIQFSYSSTIKGNPTGL